jgi:voltage-gated potassium channel
MQDEIRANLTRITILLIGVIVFGTVSYRVVEGRDWFECLYMTVITITTTGYGEIWEMSIYGRILSMFLMFFGVGIFFYAVNLLTPIFFERKMRRWERMLDKISDHYIVCGYGLMGKEIAKELPKEKVVVIDIDVNKVDLAREDGYIAIHGDATDDTILEKAQIRKAKAIICCMTDSCNAFAVIAAKALNPNVLTIVVLRSPDAEKKMRRIGVDYLLSPYRDTAMKIFALMNKKASVEFVETIISGDERLGLEKVVVNDKFAGKTLKELDLRKKTGCTVVAIVRGNEVIIPSADTKLELGDIMFVIGRDESLRKLIELLEV